MMKKTIFFALLFLCVGQLAMAQKIPFAIKGSLYGGYIVPMTKNLDSISHPPALGGELAIEFPAMGNYDWQHYWHMPTVGVGLLGINLGNPKLLGTAFAVYPYLLVPIVKTEHFHLNYKIGAGLFLWIFPGEYNVLNSGYANIDGLFVLAPWLFLFLCPAVTMRLIAEEKQQGTIELLLTRPISTFSLVVGKFLSAWLIMLVALIPSIIWYATVYILAEPMGNVDSGAFWGSFIGLIFLASVYGSIGLFGSSITRNQLTAFVVSAVICFTMFYGFELIGSLFANGNTSLYLKNIGIHAHYQSMSRGVLDSRDMLYMIIVTVLFLLGAKTALTRKK